MNEKNQSGERHVLELIADGWTVIESSGSMGEMTLQAPDDWDGPPEESEIVFAFHVPSPSEQPEPVATDDLIDRFAAALKDKLRAAEAKYGHNDGWMRDDWQADCIADLNRHLAKGDPRDVAAYCAFAWHHDWPTALYAQPREQTELDATISRIKVLVGEQTGGGGEAESSRLQSLADAIWHANVGLEIRDTEVIAEAILGHRFRVLPSQADAVTEGQLRSACEGIADDYQTSDTHHPDHVLIPKDKFDAILASLSTPEVVKP